MNRKFLQCVANLTLKSHNVRKIQHQQLSRMVPSSCSLNSGSKSISPIKNYRSFSQLADQQKTSVIATGPDGTQYEIPFKPLGKYSTARHAPKLAPRHKNARIAMLRTAEGKMQGIRHSPWRMNLICQFAAGNSVPDALLQLKFCEKSKAPLVTTLIQRTMNTARQKHGLLPSQLEVLECFATHGSHLKRVKIMGRGRAGKKLRRFSHVRIVLREIDFPLKIMTSATINQRNKWIKKMETALEDSEISKREKDEIEQLEKELAETRKKLNE